MPAIFLGVRYHIAECVPLPRRSDTKALLDANGAVVAAGVSEATHIVTTSMEFDGWPNVSEDVKIVTPSWIDKSMILGKRQGEAFYSAEPAKIFSGVTAVVAEVSNEDLQILRAGITSLGGQYRSALTVDVTHLITMPPNRLQPLDAKSKFVMAHHHQASTGINIVHPYWFDDCVRTGRHLLETPYLINQDGLLASGRKGDGTPMRFEPSREKRRILEEAAKSDENLVKELEEASKGKRKPKQDIWSGKKILLGASLSLEGNKRQAVEESIRRAGGVVVEDEELLDEDEEESEAEDSQDELSDLEADSKEKILARKAEDKKHTLIERAKQREQREEAFIDQADVFITRFRGGAAYKKAAAAHKTIGTLQWLFHVHGSPSKGESYIPRPTEQLLWYPIPRRPLVGFESHLITVTNYTGSAREYLKRIIEAMGAQFSPTLSARNTVVIAAFTKGTKTDKARNWNIPIVHHLWLEDCFRQWKNLTVGMEKYVVFARDKDYSAELAEQGVGRGVLEDGVLRELEDEDDDLPAPTVARTAPKADARVPKKAPEPKKATPSKVAPVTKPIPGPSTVKPPPSKATPKGKKGSALPPTQTDVGDADAVDAMLDDGDVNMGGADDSEFMDMGMDMDIYQDDEPVASPSKTRSKGKGKAVASPSKNTERGKNTAPIEIEEDEEEEEDPRPARARPTPKKKKAASATPKTKNTAIKRKAPPVRGNETDEDQDENDTPPVSKPRVASASSPGGTPTVELTRRFTKDFTIKNAGQQESSRAAAAETPAKAFLKPRGSSLEPSLDQGTPIGGRGPSKRPAAARAINALHNVIMPDMNNYEKEKRGGFKGKPADRVGAEESHSANKRRAIASEDDENEEEHVPRDKKKRRISGEDDQTTKKAAVTKGAAVAKASAPSKPIRMMTTGFTLPDKVLNSLVKIGVKVTTKPADCTVLVVEKYSRTPNFLCAIAAHPDVVHKDWASKSAAANKLLPMEDYALEDEEGESKFNLDLKVVLRRARENKGKLFHQHYFYLTSGIPENQIELIRKVVIANGGQISVKVPSIKKLKDPQNEGLLHMVSCPEDSVVWKPLVKEGIDIFTPEIVLGCAWSQVLDFEKKQHILQRGVHHK